MPSKMTTSTLWRAKGQDGDSDGDGDGDGDGDTYAFIKVRAASSFQYPTTLIIIRMGKCILLENDMFHTGLGLSKRKGSSVDRALIIDAFHRLGFQVFHADDDADAE